MKIQPRCLGVLKVVKAGLGYEYVFWRVGPIYLIEFESEEDKGWDAFDTGASAWEAWLNLMNLGTLEGEQND